jgi:hypothetical protein
MYYIKTEKINKFVYFLAWRNGSKKYHGIDPGAILDRELKRKS